MVLAPLLLTLPGHGIDLAAMDRSVVVKSPADLFRFANGQWLDKTSIPSDRMAVGAYTDGDERNLAVLRRIGEREAAARHSLSTVGGKVGLMYRLAMDAPRANQMGAAPLRPELARIDAVRDATGLLREIAHLESIGVQAGFSAFPYLDDKDTGRLVYTISQPQSILRDRELYLGSDERAKAARTQYVKTEGAYLRLAGLPEAGANQALALETALAKASSTPFELRDPASNYHKVPLAVLKATAPKTPWYAYFDEIGTRPARVNIQQPHALAGFDALVASRTMAEWRSFLRVALLNTYATSLSDAYYDQAFALGRVLTGQQTLSPRWKRAIRKVDGTIGEALGQLYVREAFSPTAKVKVQGMVHNVLVALHTRITELDWMSDATKEAALAKLSAIVPKIGYPDRWRDYSALNLKDDSLAANVMRANAFEWRRNLAKLDRPVDRGEWDMTPSTFNAYYNPNWNEIVFPAGILQPPVFDTKADDASNYGALAAVIGHEITHGFDDSGSQYDLTGLRRDWWTKADKANYEAKGKAIVAQYNGYRSPSGYPINGALTEGENIADIGGVTIAYLAYRRSLNGVEPPVLDGLTGDQRFFVAFAQYYQVKNRPELEKMRINTDTHSPDSVRPIGAVADLPAFYKAFGLPVPENLPHVW